MVTIPYALIKKPSSTVKRKLKLLFIQQLMLPSDKFWFKGYTSYYSHDYHYKLKIFYDYCAVTVNSPDCKETKLLPKIVVDAIEKSNFIYINKHDVENIPFNDLILYKFRKTNFTDYYCDKFWITEKDRLFEVIRVDADMKETVNVFTARSNRYVKTHRRVLKSFFK